MKTLVWVEHDNASVKDATLAVVTAASKLGEVHLLVAGSGCRAVAEAAAQIAGVGKVHLADDAAYENGLAENIAPLVADLMGHHDAFLAPATTTGKNIAPRVAALLDVMQISDILSVEGDSVTVIREVDGGLETVKLAMPAIVTTDLRLNEPRYASLPNIMKAKKKPLDEKSPADYGVDVAPRLKVLKTEEPGGRKAGVKVKTVQELVDKLKNEAGVL